MKDPTARRVPPNTFCPERPKVSPLGLLKILVEFGVSFITRTPIQNLNEGRYRTIRTIRTISPFLPERRYCRPYASGSWP